jgi:hypothetical protein
MSSSGFKISGLSISEVKKMKKLVLRVIRSPSHLNAIRELGPNRNIVQILPKCHVTSVGLGA